MPSCAAQQQSLAKKGSTTRRHARPTRRGCAPRMARQAPPMASTSAPTSASSTRAETGKRGGGLLEVTRAHQRIADFSRPRSGVVRLEGVARRASPGVRIGVARRTTIRLSSPYARRANVLRQLQASHTPCRSDGDTTGIRQGMQGTESYSLIATGCAHYAQSDGSWMGRGTRMEGVHL